MRAQRGTMPAVPRVITIWRAKLSPMPVPVGDDELHPAARLSLAGSRADLPNGEAALLRAVGSLDPATIARRAVSRA